MLKKNIILICIVFLSYLLADDPSISIESKYGGGTRIHPLTDKEQNDYYYNENIMDINFNFDSGIYLYAQMEYSRPPLKGFNFVGINNYHLEYSSDRYKIKIGDIYTLYGKGLAINMFQDQIIDYDNSLKGLELNYYLDDYSNIFS